MKLAITVAAALALGARSHELEVTRPTRVADVSPPTEGVGHSHQPYRGKPQYLAAARPLQPTASAPKPGDDNPCKTRSTACDDRLRAVLAAIDGQILALSSPPSDVELQGLELSLLQLTPLLTPYPDIAAEREELGDVVDKLPSLTPVDQTTARRRLVELTDLIRVQLAAAQ
jgi:hypothetical protein